MHPHTENIVLTAMQRQRRTQILQAAVLYEQACATCSMLLDIQVAVLKWAVEKPELPFWRWSAWMLPLALIVRCLRPEIQRLILP